MRLEFKTILLFAFILVHKLCSAQNLTVTFTDLGKIKNYKISSIGCKDSVSIQKALNNCLIPLYNKGFITASIDTFSCDSNKVVAFGKMGAKYRWVKFSPDSSTLTLLSNVGIKISNLSGKPISPKALGRCINYTLHEFENDGYPFAKVKLDRIEINQNSIATSINIDKGSKIVIDTIYLKGDARISTSKISALINLKKGEPYSELKVKRIDSKFIQQPYLKIIKPTEVEFLNHKARVYCYLSNNQASRFWGLAGFYSDKQDGKIKLNGDLNLSLVNSLRLGEKLNFSWSAPGKGTQNLNINTDWLYIFGWQVGVIGSISLYRQDSTYITFNPKLSFSFFASNGGKFLINLDYKKTSYSSNGQVQQVNYGNTTALLYGLGYEYSSYNSLVLPSRGLFIRSNVNTGSRNLNQTKSPNSNLIDGDLFVEGFIPLYENRIILALRSNSKARAIYNTKGSTTLFDNEMYRLGGMGTIRGFNQESILSPVYSIATTEIHFRLSEGSGIYLFADKGFVKAYELGLKKDSWPLGLGIGLNMVTKAGLFNLSYALGNGFGQSLGLKDAKVHFGIATVF